ncbi:unnamed protein product, partial [marine sediment metagenome]
MSQGDVLECTAIQTIAGTRFTNVFYLQQTTADPSSTNQLESAAVALKLNYFTPLAVILSDQWDLLCIEVKNAFLTGLPAWRETFTLPGAVITEPLPSQLAALLTYNTNNGGKGRTGKVYVGGAVVADELDNNLKKTFSDALSTVGLTLTVAMPNAPDATSYRSGPKP